MARTDSSSTRTTGANLRTFTVRRDDDESKFWLDPVSLAINHGFSGTELAKIEAIVNENLDGLREAWNEFFNDA